MLHSIDSARLTTSCLAAWRTSIVALLWLNRKHAALRSLVVAEDILAAKNGSKGWRKQIAYRDDSAFSDL